MLGYSEWRNFHNTAISKARTACEISGHPASGHFVDVNKTIQMPKGAEKEVPDLMLTRYACYLIARNGDPKKPAIAFAQTYFAIQTRRAERIEQRLLEAERVSARKKLSATEKELSSVIFEHTGGNEDFALIRSKGDQVVIDALMNAPVTNSFVVFNGDYEKTKTKLEKTGIVIDGSATIEEISRNNGVSSRNIVEAILRR